MGVAIGGAIGAEIGASIGAGRGWELDDERTNDAVISSGARCLVWQTSFQKERHSQGWEAS